MDNCGLCETADAALKTQKQPIHIFDKNLIEERIKELNLQYEEAERRLSALRNTIETISGCAAHILNTGDFDSKPPIMSGSKWMKRASEMIKELIRVDKKTYPSFNSVLSPIYIKLRNSYGIVLDQLRKDFRYNNDTLRYPSAFEAISDDNVVRSIFDSLLISLFPDEYFKDDVIKIIEEGGTIDRVEDSPEEAVVKIIAPLAEKMNDSSDGCIDTFNEVCSNMNCSWGNLETRYMNKNNLNEAPSRLTIIVSNPSVLRKMKKTVCAMLDDCKV